MSDIVWAVNPERDTFIDVQRRMRRHAEEIVAGQSTMLTFAAPGADEKLQMGAALRRDLLLIFKEAVNNAFAAWKQSCRNIRRNCGKRWASPFLIRSQKIANLPS